MKLLTRSSYYFILFSAMTMIMAGVTMYYTIKSIVYNQIDRSLVTEKTIIQDQIEKTDSIPNFAVYFSHMIEVKLLDTPAKYYQLIKDTDLYDVKSKSFLPFRFIKYSGTTPRKTGYVITIFQTLDEKTELLEKIVLVLFFLFLALFVVSLAVNYFTSRKLWNPFFKTINKAANFNLVTDDPLELPGSEIEEFDQLNDIVEQMTKKMRTDYINLKEYNENASHEIQTPLAVIRSKLDLLMQNTDLNKKSLDLIMSVNEATNRLLKLNQGLLLISKIENLQFSETREISFRDLIEKFLYNYEEIMHLKHIRVEKEISAPGFVLMNEILADILVSNILSNAVRYNIDDGFISCRLDSNNLIISNSGAPLDFDPALLFDRFRKKPGNQASVGLGLSIVKKIADLYGMFLSYTCSENIHSIKLTYMKPESAF